MFKGTYTRHYKERIKIMKKIYLTVDLECHDICRKNQYIDGKCKNGEYGLKKMLAGFARLKKA